MLAQHMEPAYEELEEELKKTKELLMLALNRIVELEESFNKNSKNSSKPSSTDQKSNTHGDSNTSRPSGLE